MCILHCCGKSVESLNSIILVVHKWNLSKIFVNSYYDRIDPQLPKNVHDLFLKLMNDILTVIIWQKVFLKWKHVDIECYNLASTSTFLKKDAYYCCKENYHTEHILQHKNMFNYCNQILKSSDSVLFSCHELSFKT